MTKAGSEDFLDMIGGPDDAALSESHLHAVACECLIAGITDRRVASLFHVMDWHDPFTAFAIAGTPTFTMEASWTLIAKKLHDLGGRHLLLGEAHGNCLAVVAQEGAVTPTVACTEVGAAFDNTQPVAIAPARIGIIGASQAARSALLTLRVAPAVSLHNPLHAEEMLPERALMGDEDARDELYASVYASLRGNAADDPTLPTVAAFLRAGGSLETTAHVLKVHPNTVRYRLKRAAESTGWDATDPREAYVLQTAITVGRIHDADAHA